MLGGGDRCLVKEQIQGKGTMTYALKGRGVLKPFLDVRTIWMDPQSRNIASGGNTSMRRFMMGERGTSDSPDTTDPWHQRAHLPSSW